MRLTLIRVGEMVSDTSNALTTPPVGVAYLAAYLRAHGHHVRVVDGVGEAIFQYTSIFDPPLGFKLHGLTLDEIVSRIDPEFSTVIGVSCMFSQDWPVARQLILSIRRRFPEAVIVAGGEHVTALPEFSLRDSGAIDYGVIGEGEVTLLELVEALAAAGPERWQPAQSVAGTCYLSADGAFRQTLPRARARDLGEIPHPAWDLVPIENYLSSGSGFGVSKGRNMPIIATRGCPYACTFCSNPTMWTQRWETRDPVRVVDEMELYVRQYGVDNFDFYDLTAIVRKDWITAFCKELDKHQLGITYQLPSGTRSEAIDGEVAAWLRRTGCCHMVYAPESGSERTLKRVKKKVNPRRVHRTAPRSRALPGAASPPGCDSLADGRLAGSGPCLSSPPLGCGAETRHPPCRDPAVRRRQSAVPTRSPHPQRPAGEGTGGTRLAWSPTDFPAKLWPL